MTNDPGGIIYTAREMLERIVSTIDALRHEIKEDREADRARLGTLEQWRMLHEAGDGHPRLVASLGELTARITTVEKTVGDDKAIEQAQRERQDRRMAIIASLAGVLLVVVTVAGVVLPFLLHAR